MEVVSQSINSNNDIVDVINETHIQVIQGMVARSNDTKRTYIRCLNASSLEGKVDGFLVFITKYGLYDDVVEDYRRYLEEVDMAISTKSLHLSAAKTLVNQYKKKLKNKLTDIDTTVEGFNVSRKHKKEGLNEEEVVMVLNYINMISSKARRNRLQAIFYLLAFEGLRQIEITRLKVEHIDVKNKSIKIQGKGKDDVERFDIMSQTADALNTYMEGMNDGYLFPSSKKEGEAITRRYLRQLFTHPKYGIFVKCGIDKKSVHGFRHYNITKTIALYDGNLTKVRRRSRHNGFDMLIIYDDERMSKQDVRELEEGFNIKPSKPLDLSIDAIVSKLRKQLWSYSKIAKYLNDEGYTTRKGGKFYAPTVQRLCK